MEWLLYPAVKQMAALCAKALRIMLLAAAALALAELLLCALLSTCAELGPAAILCGYGSALLCNLAAALAAPLAYWCHVLLLAQRGLGCSRFMLLFSCVLSLIIVLCEFYSLGTGKLLLPKQADAPLISLSILLAAGLLNIPRMGAASPRRILAIVSFPLLLLLALATDVPGLLPICCGIKVLTAFAIRPQLRALEELAPRLVSLPPLEDEPTNGGSR